MTRKWLATLIAGLLAGTSQGQLRGRECFVQNPSHLISAIVRALSQQGFAVADEDVTLLTAVVSTSPMPALDVVSVVMEQGESHPRTMVRVACHEAGECLPFYAMLNDAESIGASSGTAFRMGSAWGASRAGGPVVMRAGTRATLLMEDDRVEMRVSVICLESGVAGRVVRVQTPDHRKTYFAEVVSASLLKGSF